MGTSPSGKLFYGYINPNEEEEGTSEWSDIPFSIVHESICRPELFGYDGFIRYAIAVTESVVRVDWSDSKNIDSTHFIINPFWNSQLLDFAKEHNIDVQELTPGWHLVCLYF
jgi:hypothetical protein